MEALNEINIIAGNLMKWESTLTSNEAYQLAIEIHRLELQQVNRSNMQDLIDTVLTEAIKYLQYVGEKDSTETEIN